MNPELVTPDSVLWIALGAVCLLAVLGIVRRSRDEADLRETLRGTEEALRATIARAERAEVLIAARDQQITANAEAIAEQRDSIAALIEERRGLEVELAQSEERANAQLRAANDKLAQLQKLREEMAMQFRDLAQKALKTQGEALADSHVERLKTTLSPLRTHVEIFGKELKTMQEATQKERIELRKEIEALAKQTTQVSQDAVALTRALRSDQQKQGAWGEMVLQRVLETSGLREGEEYTRQAHRVSDEGGRLRPDVVVNIPGGKTLVIDSKVSLDAYADLVNAETDADAVDAGRRHLMSLRAHITGLAGKAYHASEDNSVDYVVLFVPIEGALSEALRLDGNLTTQALEKHVTIATPTTLMMALKTVAHVWAVDRRNRNAEEIAKRAGLIYDKVAGFVGNLELVGSRLDQAQDAYGKAYDQLTRGKGNVLGQIDQLKVLGARATKQIDANFEPADPPAEITDQQSDTTGK